MRVLALTSIFPNREHPLQAPFTLQQARELSRLVELRQWASIPWFPAGGALTRLFGEGTDLTGVPARDELQGLAVEHPRFLRIPRVGLPVAGAAYVASMLPRVLRDAPDVLFATWAYPDGAAALAIGRLLRIPVVVQAIGSDLNVFARRPFVRAQLARLLPGAGGVVAVSEPLAAALRALGAPSERTHVVVTGVDTERFRPAPRPDALAALGLPADARVILFVGRLVADKGIHELLDAFERIAATDARLHLVIVGDGPARRACDERAAAMADRMHVVGAANHDRIAHWLAAAWLLTLPSYMEGTPNVVLEALASGRPVVATDVGGIPSVIRHDAQGKLVPPRDVSALAAALHTVAMRDASADEIVALSGLFDWAENARRILGVLEAAHAGA